MIPQVSENMYGIFYCLARRAHIKCSGTLVVDGYADLPTKEKFEIDSWIPVIESVKDWEKLRL